ncbi:MAG TPA: glutaredoxin domain-containing protein [Chloroflexia bacterium]|nr:glutaredoxin domain-containing protein [Chloroflexia bacterium]
MNIAYFRKSNYSLQETIENVNRLARKQGWKMLGAADLPEQAGKMVLLCRPDWVKTLLEESQELIGFLPCSVSVFEKNGKVLVGTAQPAIIKALTQNEQITALASEAEAQLKELIHEAAGVGELKPTGIKLYSTHSCPYCKMEKNWLDSHKIEHQLVYVDHDQREAEAMVAKTGQMGVPVTEIVYEDGDPEFIIGFDQPRLAAILGVN